MDMNKVMRFLQILQQEKETLSTRETKFMLANCHIQLGDYAEAQRLYEISITAMFEPRPLWKLSAQSHWLADVSILSGRSDLYPQVLHELDLIKNEPMGEYPAAYYAYGVIEMLYPTGIDLEKCIHKLIINPKNKVPYASGQAMQAIIDKEQYDFTNALLSLLKVHEGQAKHGGLRETAEGLVCMSGMALAVAARKHNLKVDIENDYLSIGYLDFLLG